MRLYLEECLQLDPDDLAKWDSLAGRWVKFMSPIRPDTTDLKTIRRVILSRFTVPVNALVLGATPELCDLTSNLKIATTVVDQNPRMISAMRQLRAQSSSTEESIVADWFDYLPEATDRFDLILSDLTQGNIPYGRRAEFYTSVCCALKAEGIFVDRIFKYDESSHLYSLRSIVIQHSRRICFDLVSINQLLYKLLASESVADASVAYLGDLYDELLENCKSSGILSKQVELVKDLIAPGSVTWYCGRPWADLREDYPDELKLEEEHRRIDRYRRGLPTVQVWQKTAGTPR